MRKIMIIAATTLVAACTAQKKETSDTSMTVTPQERSMSKNPRSTTMSKMAAVKTDIDLRNQFISEVGDRVYFAFDSSVLDAEAQSSLRRQAAWIRSHPVKEIIIEGHCDEKGTREYNLALGERRAIAVRNFLSSLGVPRQKIDVISYGKERPAIGGSYERAWALNRRGVIVLHFNDKTS